MMQLYKDIKNQAISINNLLGEFGQIQKLYSSAYMIELRVRAKGETHYLKIGRGEVFQGLYMDKIALPQELRQRDKFLEILRAKLTSRYLTKIEVDDLDRAFSINYVQGGKENSFLFFYNGKSLFFTVIYFDFDTELMTVLKSWSSKKEIYKSDENKFDIFNEVGRMDLKDKETQSKILDPIPLEVSRCQKLDNKKEKFQKRKIKNITNDIRRIEKVFNLLEKIDDVDFLKSLKTTTNIEGIKFKFNDENPYARRSVIFDKIKRLRKGKEVLDKRLEETSKAFKETKETLKLPKIATPVWARVREKKEITSIESDKGYRTYSFRGFQIGIGKSARGNDSLRNEWAKKTDYWFHLDATTSPHIIVKTELVLDESIFKVIASIMQEALEINSSRIDLIYTQVKNIKGVKGTSGLVIYKKEKHLRIDVHENWKGLILDSTNS